MFPNAKAYFFMIIKPYKVDHEWKQMKKNKIKITFWGKRVSQNPQPPPHPPTQLYFGDRTSTFRLRSTTRVDVSYVDLASLYPHGNSSKDFGVPQKDCGLVRAALHQFKSQLGFPLCYWCEEITNQQRGCEEAGALTGAWVMEDMNRAKRHMSS